MSYIEAGKLGPRAQAVGKTVTEYIVDIYEKCGSSAYKAAKAEGVARATIYHHLRKAGVDKRRHKP